MDMVDARLERRADSRQYSTVHTTIDVTFNTRVSRTSLINNNLVTR